MSGRALDVIITVRMWLQEVLMLSIYLLTFNALNVANGLLNALFAATVQSVATPVRIAQPF
jgi:hypothetical protein